MAKINVLDKKVYTQIAAGEVVERPSSVVKVLVENSIDAGATEITINIFSGGKDRIEVFDNGSGISKDDLAKTILPHATSKISDVKDLEAIKTLGFRGEALASICAVSKLTITTSTGESEIGYYLQSQAGEIELIEDCPSNKGTYICVSNLFFNTPARQKFLKTARSEENDVTDMVARLILANPNISIKYTADKSLMYHSFGEGLEDAIVSVYGNEFFTQCFKIQNYVNGVKVEGYVSKINYTKPNRTYQTTILNGRYIVNQTVQSAVHNAYYGYLMKRRYPVFVLNITVPEEVVDVNVTPNKTDVRFLDNSVVYSAVYSTISKVIDGTDTALDVIMMPGERIYKSPEALKKQLEEEKNAVRDDIIVVGTPGNTNLNTGNYKREVKHVNLFENFRLEEDESVFEEDKQSNRAPQSEDIFAENKRYIEELEKKSYNQVELNVKNELIYVGQALNCFLIFEMGGDLYLVDQHAAHERLIFNRFLYNRTIGEKAIQPLLVPYTLSVNTQEYEFVSQKLEYLRDLGLEISPNGNGGFNVYSVPVDLVDIKLDKFFEDVLYDYSFRRETVSDVIIEKLIQKACKSAVKAGQKLSDSEVKALMKLLDGNINLKCPHGRPIAVRISRTEIDKWFKRIV